MNPICNSFLGTSAMLDVNIHVIGLRAIRHRHALQIALSGHRSTSAMSVCPREHDYSAHNSGRAGVGMVPRSPFGSAIHLTSSPVTFFVYLGAIKNSWWAVAVGVCAIRLVRNSRTSVALTLTVVRDSLDAIFQVLRCRMDCLSFELKIPSLCRSF